MTQTETITDPYATWQPDNATMQTDGKPDTLIVPLVEALRARGIITRASCQGHGAGECAIDHDRRGSLCKHPGYLIVDATTLDPISALRVEGPLFSRIECTTYPHFTWRFNWSAENRYDAIDCLLQLEPMEA